MGNLYTRLMAHGDKAERVFARLEDGRRYSYANVDDVTARFATSLVAMGVRPGDRVAVQVDKSIEAVMLYYATVRAGAVFLPLNTAYTPAEVEYFALDAKPKLIVCAPAKKDAIAPIAEKAGARLETLGVWSSADVPAGSFFDHVPDDGAPFATVERNGDDLAAILYTSGTTGRSKGAMITHDNLFSNAKTLVDHWRITQEDVLLHALPIFHVHGLFVAINTIVYSGASLVFLAKFEAEKMVSLMPEASVMMGVPTFYTRLIDCSEFTAEAAKGMRLFVSGSAPLLAETHTAFSQRTGKAILERYGMTETGMNTSNPYDGERRPGTVGFPLPGVELRIVNPDTREPVAKGDVGLIEVRGPNVFKGYWEMPEKTAAEFREDGFFITGDLGLIDDDDYVSIVGRGKDLIITGGFNVYPKEIETEINQIPGVVESAVIGVPHPDFGEGVAAVVVAESNASLDEAAITAPLAERLARFKQPKRVFFVDALPRNTMGKVQKNILRDQYAKLFQ